MMTAYDLFYKHYIKEGYYPQWADIKAKNDVKEMVDKSHYIIVEVPGIGECRYTGD